MGIFYIISIVILAVLSAFAVRWLANVLAKNSSFWFWISIPLPVIALCLPELTVEDEGLAENRIIYMPLEKEII